MIRLPESARAPRTAAMRWLRFFITLIYVSTFMAGMAFVLFMLGVRPSIAFNLHLLLAAVSVVVAVFICSPFRSADGALEEREPSDPETHVSSTSGVRPWEWIVFAILVGPLLLSVFVHFFLLAPWRTVGVTLLIALLLALRWNRPRRSGTHTPVEAFD